MIKYRYEAREVSFLIKILIKYRYEANEVSFLIKILIKYFSHLYAVIIVYW